MIWAITPVFDRNLFMPFHEVSSLPMKSITAPSTCTTGSGGTLKFFISFRFDDLSSPTAALA